VRGSGHEGQIPKLRGGYGAPNQTNAERVLLGFACVIAVSQGGNFEDNFRSTDLLSISFAPMHT